MLLKDAGIQVVGLTSNGARSLWKELGIICPSIEVFKNYFEKSFEYRRTFLYLLMYPI